MASHFRERCIWLVVIVVASMGVAGCDLTRKRGDEPVDFSQFAELPGLRASHLADLQAELARIVDERATPTMMMEYRATNSGNRSVPRPRLPEAENAATEITRLFDSIELKAVQNRLERTYPKAQFVFEPDAKVMLREMLKLYSRPLAKFREAVARPACDLNWQHKQGIMANVAGVNNIRAAIRLELLTIAQMLDENKPEAAIAPLEIAFRAISFLSFEPHLIPRQEAARARAEALQVVQAVAQHPAAEKSLHAHLYDLIAQQLAAWPADRLAWIGERAEGLHTFELVRNGHLLSILDEAELVKLRESKDFKQTISRIRETIEDDELFYLITMRHIIDECGRPYCDRTTRLATLEPTIEKMSAESKYPFVSLHALLKDFDKRQQLQAKDRARCEAYALVLAMAAGRPLPTFAANPLTGAPYHMLQQKDRSVIAGVLPAAEDHPIIVPIRN